MIPEADGDFSNAPNFKFNDDKVKFDTNWVSNANDNYGSVSGAVPKSLLNEGGWILSTRRAFFRFHPRATGAQHIFCYLAFLLLS